MRAAAVGRRFCSSESERARVRAELLAQILHPELAQKRELRPESAVDREREQCGLRRRGPSDVGDAHLVAQEGDGGRELALDRRREQRRVAIHRRADVDADPLQKLRRRLQVGVEREPQNLRVAPQRVGGVGAERVEKLGGRPHVGVEREADELRVRRDEPTHGGGVEADLVALQVRERALEVRLGRELEHRRERAAGALDRRLGHAELLQPPRDRRVALGAPQQRLRLLRQKLAELALVANRRRYRRRARTSASNSSTSGCARSSSTRTPTSESAPRSGAARARGDAERCAAVAAPPRRRAGARRRELAQRDAQRRRARRVVDVGAC